jgi:hypothetical protein
LITGQGARGKDDSGTSVDRLKVGDGDDLPGPRTTIMNYELKPLAICLQPRQHVLVQMLPKMTHEFPGQEQFTQ